MMADVEYIELTAESLRELGEILYKIRFRENVLQSAVAKKMGKTQGQISGYERNNKMPGIPNVISYLASVGWHLVIVKVLPERGQKKK